MVRKVVRAPHFEPERADIKKPSAEGGSSRFIGVVPLPVTHSLCPPSESSRRASRMISAAGRRGHLELRQRDKVPSSPLKLKYHIYHHQLLKMSVFIGLMTVDLVFECWNNLNPSRETVSVVVFLWYFFFLRNGSVVKRTNVNCIRWWWLLRQAESCRCILISPVWALLVRVQALFENTPGILCVGRKKWQWNVRGNKTTWRRR